MFCTVTVGRRRGLKHAVDMCVCVCERLMWKEINWCTQEDLGCASWVTDRPFADKSISFNFRWCVFNTRRSNAQQAFLKKRNQWQFCPRNVCLFKLFFTLPGGRIQGWQRTACRDRRCRTAAGRMQCALSCRTAGAQPVPAAPPSLKETLP